MRMNYTSGAQFPVVVSQRTADHSSRLSCAPRIISVGSPVVVSQRTADHSSRLNPQIYISQCGIKTLLLKIIKTTNKRQSELV